MNICITHWNWSISNRSPIATRSAVHEKQPDISVANNLIEALTSNPPRTVVQENDENNNPIYIIGGGDDDELDVVYIEYSQFPPTIEHV